MDYRNVFKEIKKGQWQGVYLLFGEEQYIKRQALDQAVEALVEPSFIDLNYSLIDGSQVDLDTIINACETLPFMAPKRVVVLKGFPLIDGGQEGEVDENEFLKYIKTISETTCLILYGQGKVDKRKRIYKHINKVGKALEFNHLRGRDLYTWISQTVGRQGKNISYNTAKYLVDRVGNDLEHILNELKKLVPYIENNKDIDIDSIDEVVAATLEQSIFKLVDAIGDKRSREALEVLGNLLSDGKQAIQPILGMVARQFRLILQCKEYYKRGYNPNSLSTKLKQRPFVVKKCLAQGRNFTSDQLKRGLKLCLELDYEIKSGQIQDTLGLE
ncbi:MAG TPA: DNA polymerase III subunit delta, partial [Clostridia bacterium]|nr:DNA polymerase III subunit delta [Clostridia bacterium]